MIKEKKFGTGDQNYLRNIFNFYDKNKKNFFNDFLEFFFYEGLNNLNENNFVKSINIKVPYIGGGLFEYFDGYDWENEQARPEGDPTDYCSYPSGTFSASPARLTIPKSLSQLVQRCHCLKKKYLLKLIAIATVSHMLERLFLHLLCPISLPPSAYTQRDLRT